ncbi:calcium-translocating P-type ATPase, PMCA-type [Tissierella praeacuta]|uniref:calcium-translocating P-type ATPase, PMCA-type n=1 Tax=Tissierella praeacuta TaxID=43131 RepID=UPI00333EE41C
MIYFNRSSAEVIKELNSDEINGLSDLSVKELQERYGPNEFSKNKKDLSWNDLSDPLIIILLIAAVISFLIGEYIDGIGIVLAITLGSVIGYLTEEKSKQAAEALSKITENVFVKCIRNGEINLVLKNDLVLGDIVLLETGNIVPADGRILESVGLKVREDMLTGESDDVDKYADVIVDMEKIKSKGNTIIQEPVPAKQVNMLFSGTLIASGRGKMIVTAIGDSTQMGKIAKSIDDVDNETPLQIRLGDLGKSIAKLSGSIALILFIFMISKMFIQKSIIINTSGVIPFLNSIKPMKNAFVVCVALVVAAVPEGLPTMINMTLAITMQKMANINALVTKKEACETIGSISVICSDKTGTLTQNKMTVEKIFINGEYKENYNSNDSYFIDNCIINSTADIKYTNNEWQYMGSATECALLVYLEDKQYFEYRKGKEIIHQIPFTSKTKRMDTIIKEGEDYLFLSKGAPEIILDFCEYEHLDGEVVKLTNDRKQYILEQIKNLQVQAMRVLGFAYKKTPKLNINTSSSTNTDIYKRNLIFTGFVGIRDPLRPDVKDAISIAEKAGVKTKMLTGDNINTAVAIGYELGLLENSNRAIESSFIDVLSDEELKEEIKTISIVARSKPETKMRIVEALQSNGEVVAVTGDGINDVPALVKADVGIAMGIAGTEVTKKSASIILTDDSFSTIVKGIQWGRGIYENFQRFIQFQLTVNIVAFLIAIISQIIGKAMPFTTIQLLWINIIMDGPPALSLGLEPVRGNLLNREPIKKDSNIITKTMLRSIIINSIFITLILFIQMFWNPLGVSTYNYNEFGMNEMQTSLFALLAFSALFNALNCREFGLNSVIPNFIKNKMALITLFLTGFAQIIFMTYYNYFFNTVPLRLNVWVKIIIMSSAVVWGNEVIKYFLKILRSKVAY